jgi:hypothetical protein
VRLTQGCPLHHAGAAADHESTGGLLRDRLFEHRAGGVGAGIYDRLGEMGYGAIVRAVNFGSAPLAPPPRDEHGEPSGGPLNRRAEMWMKSREWLEDPAGAAVPDLDSPQADACAARPTPTTATPGSSSKPRTTCARAA